MLQERPWGEPCERALRRFDLGMPPLHPGPLALLLAASLLLSGLAPVGAVLSPAPGTVPGQLQAGIPGEDPIRLREAREALDAAVRRGAPPRERAEALIALAAAYAEAGQTAEAVPHAEEGVAILERLLPGEVRAPGAGASTLRESDAALLAQAAEASNRLGLLYWNLARYEPSVRSLNRARDHWRILDDRASLGRVHNNLGTAHYQWGNFELALEAYLESLAFRREVGDVPGQARVLANKGLVYQDWSQYDEARAALAEAVRLAQGGDDAHLLGYTWQTYGNFLLSQGEVDAAERAFEEADEHFPPSPHVYTAAGFAMVRMLRGDHDEALRLLEGFLAGAEAAGLPRQQARAHLHTGQVRFDAGDLEGAVRSLETGLQVARASELRPISVTLLSELARVHEARGDPGSALVSLRSHDALRDSIFSQATGQRVAAMEARLEADRRERENAVLRATRAEQEARLARQQFTGIMGALVLVALGVLVGLLVHFNRRGREREVLLAQSNTALEESNRDLTQALSEVRALKGLIPICAHCKKVRDDQGYWEAVETYISERSEALFSHSICTECGPRVYGEDWGDGGGEGGGFVSGPRETAGADKADTAVAQEDPVPN